MTVGHAKSLIVIGQGNIGSYFVASIVRTDCVQHLVLIDPDTYEHHNLSSQDILPRDVGRYKAEVVAGRIHDINPAVRVEVITDPVERVPFGRLRATVIASSTDGLSSRRWISQAVWRLGIPWIDAGVRAEGELARVDVYHPSSEEACLECGWSDQERKALDTRHPCDPPLQSTPTGASAYLGQIAAGLQCKECVKLLSEDTEDVSPGRQLLMDTFSDHYVVSSRRRSPDCTFDHQRWSIQALSRSPGAINLRQALRLVPQAGVESPRLRMHGDVFVRRLLCQNCHTSRHLLYLASRMDDEFRRCPHCGGSMVAPGIDTTDALTFDWLAGVEPRLSLYAIGFRVGDVFTVETSSREVHFEIGGR